MHRLDKVLYTEMKQHALECFPEECCGFLVADSETGEERVRRVRNVATERHQADPKTFTRDGTDGYIMDEKELFEIQRGIDDGALEIRCIYHSHPNGRAYFSKEDEARALFFGEPIYPEVLYLVLGVDKVSVNALSGHLWNEDRREFEDINVTRS